MTTTAVPVRQFASFQQLRLLAETSAVANACIELRANEITAADWDVKPRPGTAADRDRREQAHRLLRHIDPNYTGFNGWLRDAAREMLTVDALAVWVDIGLAALMDGALIDPVASPGGGWLGYLQRWRPAERRAAASRAVLDSQVMGMYGAQESLVYRVFKTREGTLFGFPPLEQAMTRDDGTLDLQPGDSAILEAFGLPPDALGISVPGDSTLDRDGWLRDRLRFLATVIDVILRKNQMPDMRFEFALDR